jgi:hypothetical protein
LWIFADWDETITSHDTLSLIAPPDSSEPNGPPVEDEGLFKGVREEDICKRAQKVEFRDGWKEFTEQAMNEEHIRLMGILSVNWSKVFINCALRRIHNDAFMRQFEIRANVSVRLEIPK